MVIICMFFGDWTTFNSLVLFHECWFSEKKGREWSNKYKGEQV